MRPLRRPLTRGSLLLEALIAFAILAAFAVTVIVTVSRSHSSQAARAETYWLTEFARSKAEELSVSAFPDPANGVEDGRWAWDANQKRVFPDGKSRFDEDIALFEVHLTVWNTERPDVTISATTILARRP